MSWMATAWAQTQRTGSPTTKLLLLLLADHAGDDGVSWAKLKTLGEQAECSRSTVCRALDKLEEQGFIEVSARARANGSQTSNQYRILGPWTTRGGCQSDTPGGLQSDTPPMSNRHPTPLQSDTPRGCQSDTPRTPRRNLPPQPPLNEAPGPSTEAQDQGGEEHHEDEPPIEVRLLMGCGVGRRAAEKLAPQAAAALADGWTPKALHGHLTRDLPQPVRSMPALLASRLDGLPPAPKAPTPPARDKFRCPDCAGSGLLEDENGNPTGQKCHHPRLAPAATAPLG